jgi:predicted TIM-barrel fold metal-dependent hydrolase
MSANNQPTTFGRIFAPREDWLARAPAEEILSPELAIIDTHHHLWNAPGRYLVDDLLADTASGHNIEATVFIDCRQSYRKDGPVALRPVGEVEYIAGLAEQCDADHPDKTRVAAGIVGYADLTLGERVEPVLAALSEAGGGRFRGVRNAAGWHDDPVIGNNHHGAGPGHYLRADFRAGLNRLAAMGLSLDALVYHHQHADLIDLARACPDANIIMNHTGMPLGYGPFAGKQSEVYAQWRTTIPEIAACPNVTMKLGGMMMRLAAYDYNALPAPPTSEQLAAFFWRPYIEPCIELFGAGRCTFESNFPVDKMGIGYAALWNAFKRIAAGASPDEKIALFSGTARRVYRLD